MARFIDRVVVHVSAGSGGHGCSSIHREKFKPLGGPDGGNGGHGGSVVFEVSSQAHTLLDFHFHPHIKAQDGKMGMGSNRNGARGEDLVLPVPSGTVVFDARGEFVADLTGEGTRFVVAEGGRGGLGNAALVSKARKAPGFALLGEEGETGDFTLELRSVADVGLIGYPNAGKSSLIGALSAAKPKIADYPFTTLVPNLGVVSSGDTTFTVADVPGLIPGAAEGKGLGLDFLRHVDRCAVLVHVLDCATLDSGRDPVSDFEAVEQELAAYKPALDTDLGLGDLLGRPRIAVLNKIDVPDAADLADMVADELAEKLRGGSASADEPWAEPESPKVFKISAASGEGLRALTFALAALVEEHRARMAQIEPARQIVRPKPIDESQFSVRTDPENPEGFLVTGARPERWVRQTQFDNEEAVGYLADRLAKLGVEEQLTKLGAEPGVDVRIGDVVFGWEPRLTSRRHGSRGTDTRVGEAQRSLEEPDEELWEDDEELPE
ncbi:GTPase ObgE [Segniliparus rugosus]|uniref:GTPase Obg n=1 Tax=Segniliparus rugosus (strain ATCC BAA-974 / DSM 45345 / CCUG 50838 / CIP 108380 / JCM 13579 / CDC 945) TaxID=679197 RepID=E5XNZ2_SEGRC|nr:GTPase ObgE [Segniliparus rugosus]EFV13931.1 obg family GTPase CgtA [Segniliparus rugosus ATCC BAA-974]